MIINRGFIYWVNMDPTVGAEIQKTRPALVVSNDVSNELSSLVTIVPITSKSDKPYLFEVAVSKNDGGLKKDGLIKANQVRTIDKLRIVDGPLGEALSKEIMDNVAEALKIHLDF